MACDDEDPCTFDDTCQLGECVGAKLPCDCQTNSDCGALEDGNVCNGILFCDTEQFPQSCEVIEETVVECPLAEGLGAECLAPSCNPDNGECSFVSANEGGACSDGNACTIGESCSDGVCLGGVALNCVANGKVLRDQAFENVWVQPAAGDAGGADFPFPLVFPGPCVYPEVQDADPPLVGPEALSMGPR